MTSAMIFRTVFTLAMLLALFGPALPRPAALAEDATHPGDIEADDDHETARKALEQQEVLPLGEVLAMIAEEQPGDVIEIELERKSGVWIYELELIDGDGRVRELDINARTGEIMKVEIDE